MQVKKSTRLNSNLSSQSKCSTELQAKLLPCYGNGKPIFKAGKCFEYYGNIKLFTSFSLEIHLKFQYIWRHFYCDGLYSTSPKVSHRVAPIVQYEKVFIRYVRNRIDHWCTVKPGNPNPRVQSSSEKLGESLVSHWNG